MNPESSKLSIVDEFAVAAGAYCRFIDDREGYAKADFVFECASRLGGLYCRALRLMTLEPKPVERQKSMTMEEWRSLFRDLHNKLGEDANYWKVFQPQEQEDAVASSLGDDLADIYYDVKEGLDNYDSSSTSSQAAAAYRWKTGFITHWHYHCTSALHALSWLIERNDTFK